MSFRRNLFDFKQCADNYKDSSLPVSDRLACGRAGRMTFRCRFSVIMSYEIKMVIVYPSVAKTIASIFTRLRACAGKITTQVGLKS